MRNSDCGFRIEKAGIRLSAHDVRQKIGLRLRQLPNQFRANCPKLVLASL
ncbi:hypothetical protein D1AOALGA4SA_12614 [Olavius algarvensis Delta 1 endosymbiont]|nr:hypothetical protein D1AOALGA4SA_12614 [Olavius algarvensis Delta 1 endosymbiont]